MTNNNSQLGIDRYYKNGNKDYDCSKGTSIYFSRYFFHLKHVST